MAFTEAQNFQLPAKLTFQAREDAQGPTTPHSPTLKAGMSSPKPTASSVRRPGPPDAIDELRLQCRSWPKSCRRLHCQGTD